jgi:hypothetical protein
MNFGQKLMEARARTRFPTAHGPGIVLLIVTLFTICVWVGPLLL